MLKNISGGGVCLTLEEKTVVVGDIFQLELVLPTNEKITTYGRVAWIESFEIIGAQDATHYEIGIEFLEISGVQQEHISNFVFKRLKK